MIIKFYNGSGICVRVPRRGVVTDILTRYSAIVDCVQLLVATIHNSSELSRNKKISVSAYKLSC